MPSPLPYFEFWQQDWLSSSGTRRLTLAARGAYIDLLSHQWEDGAIDDDPEALARMIGVSMQEFRKVWHEIERHFPFNDDGTRGNPKLAELRARTIAKVTKNSESGKLGGRPPRGGKPKPNQNQNETERFSERLSERNPNGKANENRTANPNESETKAIRDLRLEIKEKEITNLNQLGEISTSEPPIPLENWTPLNGGAISLSLVSGRDERIPEPETDEQIAARRQRLASQVEEARARLRQGQVAS